MSKMFLYLVLVLMATCQLNCNGVKAEQARYRWWPTQKTPKSIIRTSLGFIDESADINDNSVAGRIKLSPEHMMMQSVAGLAALAVNEGRGDELVWIDHLKSESHHGDYQMWLTGVVERLGVDCSVTLKPWELVAHFKDKGIIKGYILYSFDKSKGNVPDVRPGSDHSVNAATTACPILGSILISQELEVEAKRIGLKKLLDVRGKNESFALNKFEDKLNKKLALAQDPKMPHHRAIAIANKAVVFFGVEEPTPTIYQWLEPLSSIMGWNAPGEGEFIEQLSRYGHILLPSNWAMNLPVLCAGSENWQIPEFKKFDPNTIDWDKKHAVSFIMSDGDNIQWLLGDFCNHKYYWASPDQGSFHIGWGMPYACLAQVSPEAYEFLRKTQPDHCTLNLHAGGYYFPDLLGSNLSPEKRRELLTEHARRLNYFMKKAGTTTLMFICRDLSSEAAREAYRIYAQEIENLVGMFGLEYAPYEAEEGKVLWTTKPDGTEIPIVTCKYCIWANLELPKSGTPAKIARLINEDAAAAEKTPDPLLSWSIIHAWSGFKEINDNNETAENAQFMAAGTKTGVTPTKWCVDRLNPQVKVVTPEELLWRIRMRHNRQQTISLLKKNCCSKK